MNRLTRVIVPAAKTLQADMSSSPAPVLIIGAGISGLALAQGLHKFSIPFRIFERDPVLNVRSQGYRVRITDNSIYALESLLTRSLYDHLEASCAAVALDAPTQTASNAGAGPRGRFNARNMEKIETKFGGPPLNQLHTQGATDADRSVLRSVLMHGLEEYVEFGKAFESYPMDPAGSGVLVRFSDGSEVTGRLVVCADGASSKVKKELIPDERLLDTEGRLIYGKTTLTPSFLSRFNELARNGLVVVIHQPSPPSTSSTTSPETSTSAPSPSPQAPSAADHPTTLALEVIRFKDNEYRSTLPPNYVYWVLMSRKNSTALTTFLTSPDNNDASLLTQISTPASAAALTHHLTQHWHPSIRILFDDQDVAQTSLIRVLSANAEIPPWDSVGGRVTLIGDAAHVMSPTAGVGAVTALRDAALMMEALRDQEEYGDREGDPMVGQAEAVETYVKGMRAYAGDAVVSSRRGGKILFGMPTFEEMEAVA